MNNNMRNLTINTRVKLAAIAITWAMVLPAQAGLIAVEQAYEITTAQVERWPLGETGTLVLRSCNSCESVALRVDLATHYRLGMSGANITRAELVRMQATLNDREGTRVYVFYRPESGVATRVILDIEIE